MITALVLIKVEKGKIHDVASNIGAFEEVKEVFSVTGEYDLVAKVQVKEYENMSDIVTDKFQKIYGIISTKTMMAFKTYKFIDLTETLPPSRYPEISEEGRSLAKSILSKLTQGTDLSSSEISSIIEAINKGLFTDAQIAGFLVGLITKGPSVREVAEIAKAMRRHCIPLKTSIPAERLTDTCGTGGGYPTFMEIADMLRPDAVQLHGSEELRMTERLISGIKSLNIKVIKAIRFSSETGKPLSEIADPIRLCNVIKEMGADAVLLDSASSSMPAGTGKSINWELASKIRASVDIPIILAGGLNPENVSNAISQVRPYAVDVISGVEAEKGKKDPEKVKSFIKKVKEQGNGKDML